MLQGRTYYTRVMTPCLDVYVRERNFVLYVRYAIGSSVNPMLFCEQDRLNTIAARKIFDES